MAVDVSGIAYFAPIWAFLVVFAVLYAVLAKTKVLGEGKFSNAFLSFVIATIFVIVADVREFVLAITPWFAVLLVSLFFILVLLGFVGKDETKFLNKGVGIAFLIALVLVFLISGVIVFSSVFDAYLPSGSSDFADWFYTKKVYGALFLIAVGAFVSWILVRSK